MTETASIDVTAVPTRLRDRTQWVCWMDRERDGKTTKCPVSPDESGLASSTDIGTWGTLERALAAASRDGINGIGFVFTDDDDLVGVDLDDCRDPISGELDETARDIVDRLNSYTEVSPSGTGVHVLVEGTLPGGRNRRGSVELYDRARFFTVTGDHVEGTASSVVPRQDALETIHREYVQPTDSDSSSGAPVETADSARESESESAEIPAGSALDDDTLLSKATRAANGEKFERLWHGTIAGYDSHSEADMALCCLLAFWTAGTPTQMDRLFRWSGLHREKWDDIHYADGSTYGEKTIERAIATTSEFYDPDAGEDSPHSHATSEESPATASRDESERSRAYLTEKNRLLAERVDELEATLEHKTERIETLEAEIERLKQELAARDPEAGKPLDEQAGTARESGNESETTSVWGRTKRLFDGGSG
jgi:primase-polymerase (primpol)-like protein